MQFEKRAVNPRSDAAQRLVERVVNKTLRAKDRTLALAHLGGRKAN